MEGIVLILVGSDAAEASLVGRDYIEKLCVAASVVALSVVVLLPEHSCDVNILLAILYRIWRDRKHLGNRLSDSAVVEEAGKGDVVD